MAIGFGDRWMSHFLGNFAGAKGEPIAALDSTPNFRKIAEFEDGLGKPTGGGHKKAADEFSKRINAAKDIIEAGKGWK